MSKASAFSTSCLWSRTIWMCFRCFCSHLRVSRTLTAARSCSGSCAACLSCYLPASTLHHLILDLAPLPIKLTDHQIEMKWNCAHSNPVSSLMWTNFVLQRTFNFTITVWNSHFHLSFNLFCRKKDRRWRESSVNKKVFLIFSQQRSVRPLQS